MKKVILRSLAFATVVAGFISQAVFADESATDAGKFSGTFDVQGRYVLLDTTRKTNFDFLSQRLRMGGKYTQGSFQAAGEVEFRGNFYGDYANGVAGTTSSQSSGVRQAFVSYDAYKSDSFGSLNARLGRFIPKGAKQYGPDALTDLFTISGFFPEDGLMLEYSSKPGNGFALNAQLAVVNSMQLWLYRNNTTLSSKLAANAWEFDMAGASSSFKGGSTFDGNGGGYFTSPSNASSNTSDKAYIANVDATFDAGPGKVQAIVAYGIQNNDVSSAGSAAVSSAPVTINGASSTIAYAGSPATANDVQYLEASVGYNYQDNLQAGLWYSLASIGQTKIMNDVNGGASGFGGGLGVAENYSVGGLGVQGNSKLWGQSSIFAKDDMITWGLGAQMFMRRQSNTGSMSDSNAAKNDVTMISLGAGYTKGPWYAQLNESYFMASNDVFLNTGNNNYTNSANLIYLVFGVSI